MVPWGQIVSHVFHGNALRIQHRLTVDMGTNLRFVATMRLPHGAPLFAKEVVSSNYPAFKAPTTLYVLKMMPDGNAFVLMSSNVCGGVPSAKKRFPVPNSTG